MAHAENSDQEGTVAFSMSGIERMSLTLAIYMRIKIDASSRESRIDLLCLCRQELCNMVRISRNQE